MRDSRSTSTMTAFLRTGRREEVEGVLLLAASALVLSGTQGGEGILGRVVATLVIGLGVGVLYPPLVLALWGVRRLQHKPAFRSRRELAAWFLLLPVVLASLAWIQEGAGGRAGFWLRAYMDVLLGPWGAGVALVSLATVLLCDCLDVAPRHLVRRLGGIGDTVVLMPLRSAFQGLWALLRGVHRVLHVLLRDLWVVLDVLCRRLEGALQPGDAEPARGDVAPETDANTATPLPAPVGPAPRVVVERGVPARRGADEEDELMGSPRMARALAPRRDTARISEALPGEHVAPPRAPPPEEAPAEPAPSPRPAPRAPAPASASASAAPATSPAPKEAPEAEEEEPPGIEVERPMDTMPRPRIHAEPVAPAPPDVEYELPPLHLFDAPPDDLPRESDEELRRKADLITETLGHFGIDSSIRRITCGPAITQFELVPAAGVKVSRLAGLADDLAMALAVARIRIEAPIPGRGAVGIEAPNKTAVPVFFQEIAAQEEFREAEAPLTFALGKGIAGNPVVADLAKAPHMLVAGATGAGKSVCINTIISSMLVRNTPEDVKLLLIDPKMVELMIYDGIAHLVSPVITDPQAASAALKWAVLEMERRYKILSKAGYRNIRSFNTKVRAGEVELDDLAIDGLAEVGDAVEPFPYLVVVIDELADLMMVAPKDIEDSICRLAQMARAVGIHLIVATQRPSTNVITGIIKANLPTRIAFRVASKVDSKVILDHVGAESLLGRGDMLYQPVGQPKAVRIQGAFIDDDEIKRLVKHITKQTDPEYADIVAEVKATLEPSPIDPADVQDEYLAGCIQLAVDKGEVSTSMLQRHFKIGYNRAATIIEVMEARGIVSGAESGRRRKVLIGPGEVDAALADC